MNHNYKTTWQPGTWPSPWRQVAILVCFFPLCFFYAALGFITGFEEAVRAFQKSLERTEPSMTRHPKKKAPPALKPCPFCGGEADYLAGSYNDRFISCSGCNAQTDLYRTQAEAAEAWNKRIGEK